MNLKSHFNFFIGSMCSCLLCYACLYLAPQLDQDITNLLCVILFAWLITGFLLVMAFLRFTSKKTILISLFQGFVSGFAHLGPLTLAFFILSKDNPLALLITTWAFPAPFLIAFYFAPGKTSKVAQNIENHEIDQE